MSTFFIESTNEQTQLIEAFIEALEIPFVNDAPLVEHEEELPPHVLEGIERSRADYEAGRTITLEEFKSRFISAR